MPMLKCKRCGGTGFLIEFNEECPSCAHTGMLYLPQVYPRGKENLFYDGWISMPTDYICENDIVLEDTWNYFEDKYAYKRDWWVVHQMYPSLYAIERTALEKGIIDITDIPGGPNRPEILNTMYRPYNKIREKVADNLKSDAKEAAEVLKQAQKLADQLNRLNEAEASSTPTPTVETTEEVKMSHIDRLKSGGKTIAKNVKAGAIMGTVGAANSTAVDLLEFRLGDNYPEALKGPAGRKAMEMLIPSLLIMICEADTDNRIPMKEHVQFAAQLAVQDVSRDAVSEITKVLLANLGPMLATYGQAGEQMQRELADQEESNLDDLFTSVREREKVHVEEAVELG